MRKFKFGVLVLIMSLFLTGCGCEKQTVNVTFDTDGGSEVKTQTIEKGEVVEEPAVPTREGYNFEGWYISEDATEEYDFSEKVEKDITLYAKWSMTVSGENKEDTDKDEVKLTLSKTKLTLEVGKSETIKVTTDSDKKVTWNSSDEKVVTVKDGKITAVKAGTATITVTVDGKSETIKVTVNKAASKTTTKATTTKKVESTTQKVENTTQKAESTTTQDPDKTKLSNALASIKAKTINKAGADLKYSYSGCTIENTKNDSSSDKNVLNGSIVSKVYRGNSAATVTSEYKVTCGKVSDTKTVKHTIPASTFTYTATTADMGAYVLKVSGSGLSTPYTIYVDGGEAEYSDYYGGAATLQNFVTAGKTYEMIINSDKNTKYIVKAA